MPSSRRGAASGVPGVDHVACRSADACNGVFPFRRCYDLRMTVAGHTDDSCALDQTYAGLCAGFAARREGVGDFEPRSRVQMRDWHDMYAYDQGGFLTLPK